jgi:uncharacterized protein YegP (UPF0339 family)
MTQFEIVRTNAGWHARLKGTNGEIVWSTEVYTHKTTALEAIDVLQHAANGVGLRPAEDFVQTFDARGMGR